MFNKMKKRKIPKYISIDLGTTNTLVYISGEGIVYNEPSIIAYNISRNKIVAVGNDAYKMIGKGNKNIRIINPMSNGVINNINATERQLEHIFRNLKMLDYISSCVMLLACPSKITDLEKKALKQIATNIGAKQVFIEEEVKMAAIGGGININNLHGQLVLDIGGGTTDCAVLASGDIVVSNSVKIAGRYIDEEIQKYVRAKYNIEIGSATAEKIKITIGSLFPSENESEIEIYGRDFISGLPRAIVLKSIEIRELLQKIFEPIVNLISETLNTTPAELSGDIYKTGIVICGGGALIKGIDQYINKRINLPTKVGEYPLLAVINGTKQYELEIS